MHRLLTISALSFAVGCPKDEPAAPKEVEYVKLAAPTPREQFVQASTLKLRAEPRKDGLLKGRLRINYPVEMQEERNGFALVALKNGSTGWVGRAFLGPEPVTKTSALAKAKAAASAKEKLTWLQRAAAVASSDVDTLKKLAQAYEDGGETKSANVVRRLIGHLDRRWYPVVPRSDGEVWIEWRAFEQPTKLMEVPKSRWGDYGVTDELELWLLGSHGGAVKARVVKAEIVVRNECGGDEGLDVRLDAALADGANPLVATLGAPPKSWLEDAPAAGVADLRNELQRRAATKPRDYGPAVVRTYVRDGVARGAIAFVTGEGADPMTSAWTIETFVAGKSGAERVGESKKDTMFLDLPIGERDITGDGAVDRVTTDGCATTIHSDGISIATSAFRCCGC